MSDDLARQWYLLLGTAAITLANTFINLYRGRALNQRNDAIRKREARDAEIDDRLDIADENFAEMRPFAKKDWGVYLRSSKQRRHSDA